MDQNYDTENPTNIFNGKSINLVNGLCSLKLEKLYSALVKAQAKLKPVEKKSKNPYFNSKYAQLSAIEESARPHLAENDLGVAHNVITLEDGRMNLVTELFHISGQFKQSVTSIDSFRSKDERKRTIQEFGSILTYLERYQYAAIVGITVRDEDDDGEGAMERTKIPSKTPKKQAATSAVKGKTILDMPNCSEMMQKLEKELKKLSDKKREETTSYIFKALKISNLESIPNDKYPLVLKEIEKQHGK